MSATEQVIKIRRADAIRNEAAVRLAARRVFAQRGRDMTMELVATSAGVSKGTVYNVFGSRDRMVEHLTIAFLQEAAAEYRAAADAPDPWNALTHAILKPSLGMTVTADLLDPDAAPSPTMAAMKECMGAFGVLLDAAKEAGLVRAEIRVGHIATLFRGLYSVLPRYEERIPAVTREHAEIILRGIRC